MNNLEFPEFIIHLNYGGHCILDVSRTMLFTEGDFLIVSTPGGTAKLQTHDGGASDTRTSQHLDLIGPRQLVKWLMEDISPKRIRLAMHPDLFLPLNNGKPTNASLCIRNIVHALRKRGICVTISDASSDMILPVGQWVKFTDDYAVDARTVVTEGMLGQVVPDPGAVCTPGVSVMVQTTGANLTYGFPCQIVTVIDPPSEMDLEQASQLAARAWTTLQEKNRWFGIVLPGLSESKALFELKSLAARIRIPKDHASSKGNLKRVARILRGFRVSPVGESAMHLADRCQQELHAEHPSDALMNEIVRWVENYNETGQTRA